MFSFRSGSIKISQKSVLLLVSVFIIPPQSFRIPVKYLQAEACASDIRPVDLSVCSLFRNDYSTSEHSEALSLLAGVRSMSDGQNVGWAVGTDN